MSIEYDDGKPSRNVVEYDVTERRRHFKAKYFRDNKPIECLKIEGGGFS